MALPESCHLLVRDNFSLERFGNCRTLLVAQDIDARAPRLDLARDLGQFLLVLLGPGGHVLEDFFDLRVHTKNISAIMGRRQRRFQARWKRNLPVWRPG